MRRTALAIAAGILVSRQPSLSATSTENRRLRGGPRGWWPRRHVAAYSWQMCTLGPMLIDGYAGWRALQVDYVQGAGVDPLEFDVLQQGPIMGITGRF
jgi:hypothetical protein